ncbi:hypothetical protein Agub_g13038, partial [Astrephomene gubernaculifera]
MDYQRLNASDLSHPSGAGGTAARRALAAAPTTTSAAAPHSRRAASKRGSETNAESDSGNNGSRSHHIALDGLPSKAAAAATTTAAGVETAAAAGDKGSTGELQPLLGAAPMSYDTDSDDSDAESGGGGAGGGSGRAGVDGSNNQAVDTKQLFRKVSVRLLPLFFLMVVMCYVDRTALAFAAIQLNADLGFAPAVYGVGSGLFFLGYSFFQIPSNLLLRRFGGPAWLAFIIAAWGLAASCFAGMRTAAHFYGLRLLLGATEAGAFPGMWYVLTNFFPGDKITFPFAVVEAGISVSHVVAAPLAAACLQLDGAGGLAGWRWLFLLEGLPTLGLAVAMYRLLPRSPDTADFLTVAERKALVKRIQRHAERSSGGSTNGTANSVQADDSSACNAGGSSSKAVGGDATAAAGGGALKARRGVAAAGGCSASNSSSSGTSCVGSSKADGGVSGGGGGAAASSWSAVRLAVANKYVWYMGAVKFLRDIASFGLIFWAPTIVNALLHDMAHQSNATSLLHHAPANTTQTTQHPRNLHHDHRHLLAQVQSSEGHGTGAAAVLLTSLPFATAALVGMLLAHSSQRSGERFLHVAVPYILAGAALTLYAGAADRSPWLGFAALSVGVVGVYCGSGPTLALLAELAAGPGLVVALPLYNSLGTLGGFLGPSLVGWLVQRAQHAAAAAGGKSGGAAAIRGGGFGVSAVVLGSACCLAGCLMLVLGGLLGRLG